jgi:hypothetical protein
MKHKLPDSLYDEEINRMSQLSGFPHVPRAQQDLRKAMRRVTEVDANFLHRLVSEIIDTCQTCPTPRELTAKAEALRRQGRRAIGKPDCPECHGAGFVQVEKFVAAVGYEVSMAQRCKCNDPRSSAA